VTISQSEISRVIYRDLMSFFQQPTPPDVGFGYIVAPTNANRRAP
jgi:hypothetical protein